MLFLRRGGIILNRKKISRLIAGALATSVVLNSSPSAVESVHAITKDIYSEFSEGHGLGDDAGENSDDGDANENTTDNSGTNLSELSGVSIEQMQRDFEGFSNGNEVNLLSDGDDSSTKVTIGQGGANSSQDSTSVTNNSNFIYLSDLDYIDSLSRTDSPHPIRKNRNPDGNIITLQINDDGTTKQFGKGMAAHADTDLVYDISNYSDKFTKLTTWVGIDTYHASHKDEGPADGVTFKFYVSNDLDSDQWKQVGDAVTVKQGYTAKKVTIDVKDYKYVKLETKKMVIIGGIILFMQI